jgi:Fuc2NAc and GlcNAc transferase
MVSNTLIIALIWASVLTCSYVMTSQVLSYARRRGIQDVPNERSSHSIPTPRGGGLAIVLAASLGWSVLTVLGWLDHSAWVVLVLGGGLVAGIGWLDDHRPLSARVRLGVQLASAVGVVAILLGRLELLSVIAVLYLVWMTNLYNFMDGIDGIAGGQCASVAAVLALYVGVSGDWQLSAAYGVLAAAALGFLRFNWHPARIFMGDVGSGFLGFVFGTLSLCQDSAANSRLEAMLPVVSIIAMGAFIVDSGVTLGRRLLRGEKVWLAHREHAYQKAARAGKSHTRVSWSVVLINFLWLGPWVMLTFARPDWTWRIAVISLLPLVVLTLKYRAGTADELPEKR